MRHAGFLGRIGQTRKPMRRRQGCEIPSGARACRQELHFVSRRRTSGTTISNTPSFESYLPSASMSRSFARTRRFASFRGCTGIKRSGIDSMSLPLVQYSGPLNIRHRVLRIARARPSREHAEVPGRCNVLHGPARRIGGPMELAGPNELRLPRHAHVRAPRVWLSVLNEAMERFEIASVGATRSFSQRSPTGFERMPVISRTT